MRYAILQCCFILSLYAIPAYPQGMMREDTQPPPWEQELFYYIYRWESPLASTYFRWIDATAYPVFFSAVPASFGVEWARGVDNPWRLSLAVGAAEALGYVSSTGLKYLFKRLRPYEVLPDVEPRVARKRTPYAFPSGHTTIAFAIAVSIALYEPRWYVVTPAVIWASSVGISRVWLGVHYPSDVLAGALLGTLCGWIAHQVVRRYL